MSSSANQALSVRSFSTAPLRNRLRVLLDASLPEVWALVGDPARLPDFTGGLERVDLVKDAKGKPTGFICHFKPLQEGGQGFSDPNVLRWHEPNKGYASSAAHAQNAFGLRNDYVELTVEPVSEGTMLTYLAYFDADDVDTNRAGFDQAFAETGERLVARFGGHVVERYVDVPIPAGSGKAEVKK